MVETVMGFVTIVLAIIGGILESKHRKTHFHSTMEWVGRGSHRTYSRVEDKNDKAYYKSCKILIAYSIFFLCFLIGCLLFLTFNKI